MAEIQRVTGEVCGWGVSLFFIWVRGHQDEATPEAELDREPLLDIECDVRAGMMRADPPVNWHHVAVPRGTLRTLCH